MKNTPMKNGQWSVISLRLEGTYLDNHGYLVDIVDIENSLDQIVHYYSGQTLNDLPEFAGLNPSIENLSRITYFKISGLARIPGTNTISVRVWENDLAWAAFRD